MLGGEAGGPVGYGSEAGGVLWGLGEVLWVMRRELGVLWVMGEG